MLVRDKYRRETIVAALAERGVTVRSVDRETPRPSFPLAMTMHRAKGLEFTHVLLFGVQEVARFLLDEPWTQEKAEESLTKRLERTDLDGPAGALTLVIEHDGTPVGDVALRFTDHDRRVAEIGWVLDPNASGHGYAREAVRAVLALGFETYQLHRVFADGRPQHQLSETCRRPQDGP